MKYSIIIPIYNVPQDFLKFNLNRLLDLPLEEIEILLIDDGSEEYIKRICEFYIKKDLRFQYYRIKNSGVSFARNYALKIAKGENIIFLDADDYLNIENIKCLKNIDNSDLTIFDFMCIQDYKTKEKRKLNIEYKTYANDDINKIYKILISSGLLNGIHAKIYKKLIIDKNNITFPNDMKYGEDFIFNLEYFKHCSSIDYRDDIFSYYRIYNTSSIRKFPISRFDDFEIEFEARKRFFNQYLSNNIQEYNLYEYMQKRFFGDVINFILSGNSFKEIDKVINTDKIKEIIDYTSNISFYNKLKMYLIRNRKYNIIKIICFCKKMKGIIKK